MSRITIVCPDCGKKITVDILTIDTLKEEIAKLKAQITKLQSQQSSSMFDSMFGGFTK